ncbi:hypothetical protein Ccur_14090 [Cryptobacterium curtum DSM 15641]|uniref:Aminopeptidase n=1 Tax=Cryptobacterium curtum (strain ATCC 700683 / DSM 15641 / CCUG 43107 / 12-3) TaxID=469378 RepID=C7MLW5_CRYCD|nr:hypothetical protein [Cryptobacterium curtum]ACU95081.1 hypothetical protein Ccur_14090 [Cryptobacterium curtum DSM 15641]
MSTMMDDIAYLSQEIGPRPAGTEEEQRASEYLAQQFRATAGLRAQVEEFACNSQPGIIEAICFGVAVFVTVIALLLPMMTWLAFALTLVAAGLIAAEMFGQPVLSRLFQRGISQNVVVRYHPGEVAVHRHRKVIIVAPYDTGKVLSDLNGLGTQVYSIIQKSAYLALAILPILWLLQGLVHPSGAGAVVFAVLLVIAAVLALAPAISFGLHRAAAYNEGANNNASASAVLVELARRLSGSSAGTAVDEDMQDEFGQDGFSSAEFASDDSTPGDFVVDNAMQDSYVPSNSVASVVDQTGDVPYSSVQNSSENTVIHGAAAAEAAGVVPEGAELVYEVAPTDVPAAAHDQLQRAAAVEEKLHDQERKPADQPASMLDGAAVPALTGNGDEEAGQSAHGRTAEPDMSESSALNSQQPANSTSQQSTVPDWYKAAQQKAKRPQADKPAKRSRYADALDAAVAESSAHFNEANRVLGTEARAYAEAFQPSIREVAAPTAPEKANNASALSAAQNASVTECRNVSPSDQSVSATDHFSAIPSSQNVHAATPLTPRSESLPNSQSQTPMVSAPRQQEVVAAGAPSSVDVASNGDAGQTTAMPPLDVSSLQQPQRAENLSRVEQLQKAPSRRVMPAVRRGGDRVVVNGTDDPSLQFVDHDEVDPRAPINDHDVSDATIARERAARPSVSYRRSPSQGATALKDTSLPQSATDSQRTAGQRNVASPAQPTVAMRPIDVSEDPDINASALPNLEAPSDVPPAPSDMKQPAPLAAAAEDSSDTAAKTLLSSRIPRVNPDGTGALSLDMLQMDNKKAALRNTLPSMSGSISAVSANERDNNSTVSLAGSFASAGATGSFAPVGDELVADVAEDELYIDDADDSDYESQATQTGSFAGPGYMEMPTKRGFFSRLFGRRKKDVEEQSTSEWLDIGDDFNPREVGAARGGWESFQEGSDYQTSRGTEDSSDSYDQSKWDHDDEDKRWNGGAFSRARAAASDLVSRASYARETDEGAAEAPIEPEHPTRSRAAHEGVSPEFAEVARMADRLAAGDSAASEGSQASPTVADEMQEIYALRGTDVTVEVWLVALGSSVDGNAGMKAFLRDHHAELRGSIVINLESLGGGTLSYIDEEGAVLTRKLSARVKRYLRMASQASGILAASAKIDWRDSAASVAMKNGLQAVTVAGMAAGKPAGLGQGDDVVENIDAEALQTSVDYVLATLKNI